MAGEPLFELRRRTFDTPEFRGITFIEAEAKSIINRAPPGPYPFRWTLNPYRGCSHACVYCLWGETPILMADGRSKRLAEVRAGDRVYGTVRRGDYRRYVKTTVLASWSTVKRAYRVLLEDGTVLITSGDHRFLTERGWKHVTGAGSGGGRRPHLTTNNSLLGTGRLAEPPKQTEEYRRGYLCGMIRGDGLLRSFIALRRASLRLTESHQFRLALADPEGLERTASYLTALGVETTRFAFHGGTRSRRPMTAIRTQKRGHIEAIKSIIEWPAFLSDEWCKGFLAGIFDAEGSYSRGILRISNADGTILDAIGACLDNLGFAFVLEDYDRPNRVRVVRLRGGLRSALRFFLAMDPAITRKRDIEGQAIKNGAALVVRTIEPLDMDLPMYDITTGTGDFIANGVVSHNCFARVTHTYMDMNPGRDFETKIVVKVNAPEVLRAQLRSRRWHGDHIAMGTATDPYQRAEGRYRLMPEIIAALTNYRNPFSILTKGTLILRDLELLVAAAEVAQVSTALSIGTLNEHAWHKSEPGTPHPRARMEAVAALNAAGIPCGVMVAPVLPGITDDPGEIRRVVEAAVEAGATFVSPILLHLRPGVREEYMAWLTEHYPDLVPRYEQLYARSSYVGGVERKRLGAVVSGAVRAAGGVRIPPERWRAPAPDPAPEERAEQQRLF